jgi:hypothetical protein
MRGGDKTKHLSERRATCSRGGLQVALQKDSPRFERTWRQGPTLPDCPEPRSVPTARHPTLALLAKCGLRGVGVSCEGATTPQIFDFRMMLDPEQWKIVLEVYAGHHVAALNLAYQLIEIKRSLKRGQKGIQDAMDALDLAVEALYPHTDFYKTGRTFFQQTIEGRLKPEQEEKLRQLGVKL